MTTIVPFWADYVYDLDNPDEETVANALAWNAAADLANRPTVHVSNVLGMNRKRVTSYPGGSPSTSTGLSDPDSPRTVSQHESKSTQNGTSIPSTCRRSTLSARPTYDQHPTIKPRKRHD